MKLINAKKVNITEEFVDIDNVVDFEREYYKRNRNKMGFY